MRSTIVSRMLLPPYALAHRPQELPLAGTCVLALVLVFIGDITTPVQIAVSALGLLPLLTAMWLLSAPLALVVAAVAIGQLLLTGILGTLSLVTVASEATAYVVLAAVCRLYAGSLADLLFGASHPSLRRKGLPSLAMSSIMARRRAPNGSADGLTRRERQVARLAAQGYTAREIGNQLHIGKRTVETHLANAYDKLGVRSKRELIQSATAAAGSPTADA